MVMPCAFGSHVTMFWLHKSTRCYRTLIIGFTGIIIVKKPYPSKQRLCQDPSAPLLALSLSAQMMVKECSAQHGTLVVSPARASHSIAHGAAQDLGFPAEVQTWQDHVLGACTLPVCSLPVLAAWIPSPGPFPKPVGGSAQANSWSASQS